MKQTSSANSTETNYSLEEKQRKKRSSKTSKNQSRKYSIRPLIMNYKRYRKERITEERFINIKGDSISYEKMFINIANLNMATIPQNSRIYFGKVFINKIKDKDDYSIVFAKKIQINEKQTNPSLYISKKMMDESRIRKNYFNKFEEFSKINKPILSAFIYSYPVIKEKDKRTFIVLYINNFDLLEVMKWEEELL